MKTKALGDGTLIYAGFAFPEDTDGLDEGLLRNTLDYKEFCAEMCDDYDQTLRELRNIQAYRESHGLLKGIPEPI